MLAACDKGDRVRSAMLRLAAREFASQREMKGGVYDAPRSPSPAALIREAMDLLEKLGCLNGRGKRVVDLGCGDGRWLVAACERFSDCRAVGYEIDEELLKKARTQTRRFRTRVELRQEDFFAVPRLDFDVVIAYLFREGCAKLEAKLEDAGLSEGSVVVCVGFSLPSWRPIVETKSKGLFVRIYRR